MCETLSLKLLNNGRSEQKKQQQQTTNVFFDEFLDDGDGDDVIVFFCEGEPRENFNINFMTFTQSQSFDLIEKTL